jgi:uncharacterized protein YceH (UPF0502 family)
MIATLSRQKDGSSMTIELNAIEARIVGSLMEKSVYTPDQYPLTLNALTLACNQKSSREPVMNLEPGEVQNAVRQLERKHLVTSDEHFRGRVERYAQRFCNTPFSELKFSPAEFAVICLLLLRGPQTPGELRTRSGRLYEFADNEVVSETLEALMARPGGGLVARLPRKPNRHDHEYMHLFGGFIESAPMDAPQAEPSIAPSRVDRIAALEARVEALERALAAMQAQQ